MNNIDILEELKPEKMDLIQLIRTFKREGIENFITIRREKFETLIAENKELKEREKSIQRRIDEAYKGGYTKGMLPQVLENWHNEQARIVKVESQFIPKSKIKKKIEELNKDERKQLKGMKGQDRYVVKQEFMYKRNILQELLDERNNTDE